MTASAGGAGTITAVSVKPITSTISSDSGPLVLKPATSVRIEPASGYGVFIGSNTQLFEDAAGVLGLRNSTTAQEMRVYNTYTSSTNYEALRVFYSGNVAYILSDKGSGGGIGRAVHIGTVGDSLISFRTNNAVRWSINGSSAPTYGLYPEADNSYDIGHPSFRVRSGYFGTATLGGGTKSLTDNSATIFLKVTMTSGSTWGGKIIFKLEGKDATDFTIIEGDVHVSAIDKAGTITCSVATPTVTTSLTSAGTSTLNGFTCSDAGSNVLNISANYTTSLTDTTNWPKILYRVDSVDTATLAQQ